MASSFILACLTLLLIYRFTTSLPRADQHNLSTDTGLDPGWAILADNPSSPALISGDFAERVALQYLITVWGVDPHLYPTDAGDFNLPRGVSQADLTTYISRRAVAAAPETIQSGRVYPQAAGEQLIALWPNPRNELPAEAIPLDVAFGDRLRLRGWEFIEFGDELPERSAQSRWQIALYWQTLENLMEDYTVSVRPLVGGHLIMAEGTALIQDHQPVWGVYPTSRWTPNEIVRDVYALVLPEGVNPEAVQIVVYRAKDAGFENLAEVTISR